MGVRKQRQARTQKMEVGITSITRPFWHRHCVAGSRGMGFIKPNDDGKAIFVHRSQLWDGGSLVPGAETSFTIAWDERAGKYMAAKVTGAVPQPTSGRRRTDANPGSGW